MKLRNNENKIAFLIIISVLVLVSLLWFAFENPSLNPRLEKENYTIIRKWEMPKELDEISGITWVGENRIACVQDEEGIIFIYDLASNAVEKTVNFSKAGDYEGIAVVDSTAFVLRSDGELFEIVNYMSDNFEVKTHDTPFSGKNNMESLTIDKENNRLLLMPKDKDLKSADFIGIYAFNLDTKKMEEYPILSVKHNDPIFKNKKKDDDKESKNAINPADIAINPLDGNFYILEGKKPQLLIVDSNGKTIKLHKLIQDTFNQPEGIIFSTEGTMYISNEGKKGTANILEVEFDE
jgi:uncharacterized protein YjiK